MQRYYLSLVGTLSIAAPPNQKVTNTIPKNKVIGTNIQMVPILISP